MEGSIKYITKAIKEFLFERKSLKNLKRGIIIKNENNNDIIFADQRGEIRLEINIEASAGNKGGLNR